MLLRSHGKVVFLSIALLAADRGEARQAASGPGTAKGPAANPTDEEIAARYQALVARLPPEEQAWEKLLQENLGDFYLPRHQRDKVRGVSNSWDFVKDDPKLPRVLLIGDSISRGYTQACRKALAGKANVHRAPANCGPTTLGLAKIDIWLGDGDWDLIYFNFGVHDHVRASPVPEYSERLEKLVERLRRTRAKLVWASTTPWPATANGKPGGASVMELNAAAVEVMNRHQVAIDDLFTVISPHVAELQLKDGHFRTEGYDLLGEHVANFIEQALR